MMTKPQRARWNSRTDRAADEIAKARAELVSTFEVCPERAPSKDEPKEEEGEALAATSIREALTLLSFADGCISTATIHLDWERSRAVRNFPLRARELLKKIAANEPEYSEEISALLASTETKP